MPPGMAPGLGSIDVALTDRSVAIVPPFPISSRAATRLARRMRFRIASSVLLLKRELFSLVAWEIRTTIRLSGSWARLLGTIRFTTASRGVSGPRAAMRRGEQRQWGADLALLGPLPLQPPAGACPAGQQQRPSTAPQAAGAWRRGSRVRPRGLGSVPCGGWRPHPARAPGASLCCRCRWARGPGNPPAAPPRIEAGCSDRGRSPWPGLAARAWG